MPDRRESSYSVAARFDEDAGWRETYLAEIGDPEHQRPLRELSRVVIAWAREYSRLYPPPPESAVRSALRAAAADLRHLHGYLAAVASWPHTSSVEDRDELRLCGLSEELAEPVTAIAGRLEAAIGSRHDR